MAVNKPLGGLRVVVSLGTSSGHCIPHLHIQQLFEHLIMVIFITRGLKLDLCKEMYGCLPQQQYRLVLIYGGLEQAFIWDIT